MSRVIIGAPLYNRAEYLPTAIESLLAQTYRDLRLVLLDDCSSDETPALARRYAAADERVTFVRNERRLGLIPAWLRVYELAREVAPEMEYFAWGSDHDFWCPEWVEKLVAELDGAPEAVAVYPEYVSVNERDEVLRSGVIFETAGVGSRWRRLVRTYRFVDAGNMVYGLFRRSAVERAGVFRRVLGPDRLLLAELALHGELRQVREFLWKRRYPGRSRRSEHREPRKSVSVARAKCFPDGAPWYTFLPVALVYVGAVFVAYVVRNEGGADLGRMRGLVATLALAWAVGVRAAHRRARGAHKGMKALRRSVDRRLRGRRVATR
jgi:glycosyltransferase involved in cell wall biosynthesis